MKKLKCLILAFSLFTLITPGVQAIQLYTDVGDAWDKRPRCEIYLILGQLEAYYACMS
ncbi:hypothetical protein [Bartonella sp. DGB1]|uniref:hypothetical protein n=1 Tax=Bartonella sp. DGB1 TaxID=3239807 RepID=UPI00352553CB